MSSEEVRKFFAENKSGVLLKNFAVILVFIVAISYMIGSGFSPFLYFRF